MDTTDRDSEGSPVAPLPGMATIDALLKCLWRCGVASGMDTDGDDGPGAMVAGMGIGPFAMAMVREVERLRSEYEEVQRDLAHEVGDFA